MADVDFEAEGLLDGIDDARARVARLELLTRLHADGAGLDELREAVQLDRLVLVPIERALGERPAVYSRAQLAAESRLTGDFLRDVWRALGMPEPPEGEVVFTEDDLAAAKLIADVRAAGMPDAGLLEISRVMGQGMARLASSVGGVFGEAFAREGDTERDAGERYGAAAQSLAPTLQPLLTYVFDIHQRQSLRRNMISREEVAAGRLSGGRPIAVAFADLVGFTKLGSTIPAAELGAVAGRMEQLAAEVAHEPVRLVKMIGDAAMLVSLDVEPLIEAALSLTEAADAEGEGFPQLRVGLATGDAISRAGDWFGHPVNLASRIASHAWPGSVLTTADVQETVGEGAYQWSRAGKQRFKGLREDVNLDRARRTLDPDG